MNSENIPPEIRKTIPYEHFESIPIAKDHTLDSGIAMKGNGDAFARALDAVIAKPSILPFTYCEIGLGHGQTFRAVNEYLRMKPATVTKFEMVGVDNHTFPEGEVFPDRSSRFNWWFFFSGSEQFLKHCDFKIHFALIDGCHCYDCAKADFLGLEKVVAQNGVIALHDVGIPEQGMEPQYGHGPIGVRKACEDLGLIPCTRPGWKLLEETNPYAVGGRACLFVQKL